jgi:hypothetical protein
VAGPSQGLAQHKVQELQRQVRSCCG